MFNRSMSYRFIVIGLAVVTIGAASAAANWGRGFSGLVFFGPSESGSTLWASPRSTALLVPTVKTVCDTGSPDLPSVAAAVADANTNFPTGNVTYDVCAGLVETAPAGGYVITASGSAGNEIIFEKSGAGTNPTITASAANTSGALNDAIFKIIGGDFITINGFTMLENPANTTTTAASNNMTEFGVALFYASVTDGAQNNTIKNNTITLNRTYQNTWGIYSNSSHSATSVSTSATATGAAGGNSGLKIYGNAISNVNQGILVVGPTAAADMNTGVDIGGTGASQSNSITNWGTTGTFSSYANVSGTLNGILIRNSVGFNVSYNTVTSSVGGNTVTTSQRGIYVPSFSNAPTGTFTDSINNNNISIQSGFVTGTLNGIIVEATTGTATSSLSINNNDFNTFGHTVASPSGATTFISSAMAHLNTTINSNTFTNITLPSSGSVTFISNSVTFPAGGTQIVNGNSIVTGFNKTGAGGTVTLFTNNGSSPATVSEQNNNNNFSNIVVTGATTIAGWSSTDGGSPSKIVSGNTFNNWSGGTGAFTGLVVSFSGQATVSNNTVSNFSGGGTTTGISAASGGSVAADVFTQNTIFGLTGSGTGTVTGILCSSGTTRNITRNKVYGISNTNAGGGASGITVSGGTTINVQNNLVGGITAPNLNAANSLFGINISGGTTVTADFNNVYLNASSVGALFGSSALNASSTPAVTLRNNILVNNSGIAGAGLAAAYRRSSTTLTTYQAASNNNDFFGSTIFTDGTNTDTTLAAYKARVASRDSASISENPPFLSTDGTQPTFLHINPVTPTQIESGGVPVAGITNDFDGDARNVATPDIGADEFTGVLLDLTGPTISYTPLGGTSVTTDRVLNISVVDPSGVPTAGAGLPVIYYRKNAGGYVSSQCSFSGGSAYSCPISTAAMGGLATADVVGYYVAAQDTLNNVSVAPSAGSGGYSANPPAASTPPTTPSQYTIVAALSGSFNVGTGEAYTSLSNAGGIFEAINNGALTGDVIINITSDLTGELGTVALNQWAEDGAGNYHLTIKPSGAARSITGTSAAGLIKISGADRVTIDGSLTSGTDRSLTITNSGAGTIIWIASNTTFGGGANNNTIKNSILVGGGGITVGTQGIIASSGATLGGAAEFAQSSNTIQNNLIYGVQNAVFTIGNGTALDQNWVITGNDIGSAVTANKLAFRGVAVQNAQNFQITQNRISGISSSTSSSSTMSGILFGAAVNGGLIDRNDIRDIRQNNTTGWGSNGIQASSTSNASNVIISNNFISDVTSIGFAGVTSTDNGYGIMIVTGAGYKIYHNSVNMNTNQTAAGSITAAVNIAAAVTTSGGLDVRNNVFANTQTVGTRYAIYDASTAGNAVFTPINNNNYFAQNVGFLSAAQATLGAWQTATGQDANSLAVDPLFVSATDLHIQPGSPMINVGATGTGVTSDFDGYTRDAMPDIGADELDTTPPDTQILTTPPNPSNTSSPTFTFSGTDSAIATVASFECSVDADPFTPCTSPTTPTGLLDGTRLFRVRAIDAAGNVDPTPASYTWVIDTVAPDTSILTNPTNPSNSADASFTFTGSGVFGTPTLTYECKLDAGAFASCTSPQNYTELSQGSHNFQVRAIDLAGNVDPTPASYTWTVDAIAPDTQILTFPPDPSNSADAAFTFSASDSLGFPSPTFECKLDAGAFAACTSPQNYVGLTDGSHTFQVRAVDFAGNIDPTPASYTWTISTSYTGPVTVTATAGTPGPTDYPTVKDAFDAINAGTHQGDIIVNVVTNTTETASAVLNSSGAGSASYTSVLVRPYNDGVTVSGPTLQGRGLIELNGADNVTINGDNPNTSGINRNLTLQNTAANTVTFTSVVRIALATTIVTSADGDTIKNLNLVGNATGRNVAGATSTTGTENTTFGVLAGPGASTVSSTTAPSAITSVSTSVGAGATANNLLISNNAVATVGRGVSVNGSATTVFPGVQITANDIGNPTAGAADQVTAIGITAQGSSNGFIAANNVWVEGYVASSASTHGINVGVNSANGTFTIDSNRVNRVKSNNGQSYSAFGINLGGGSNHVVQNNFVSGVINDQTAGTGAFSTTFGAFGIRVASGTGHKVYHNSVNLYGVMGGVTSTDLTAAFGITSTTLTGVDVRNNIFANTITAGNPTGSRHVAVYLPSGATVSMNLTDNNNAYFSGTDANDRLAQTGTTFGAGEYLAANFDPSATTPATNFRGYTSPLSAAGTNDNASFVKSTPPPFASTSDLHIPNGTVTAIESGGAAVGVTVDIDGNTRPNGTAPDIGADEFTGVLPPANDIAANSFIVPANGGILPSGTSGQPQASFTNVGIGAQTNVSVQFAANGPMGYTYTDTQIIPSINPGSTVTVTFATAPTLVAGSYTMSASVITPDANAANDVINGGFTAVPPVSGTVTVGGGGDFASLTNPGGLFDRINTLGTSGPVVANITTDLTAETGAVALNEFGSSLTIKPSGGPRTISGTSAASSGLIILNGADNVTFDGSLSGGTDRSLTITNNQLTTGIVIWMRSAGSLNGANNNTIKNCVINGAPGPNSPTVAGVLTGSGVTLGGDAEAPNSNNTIQNNWIYRVQNSLYLRGGATAPLFDSNWNVTGNTLGSTVSNDKNIFRGMLIGNSQNFTINGNTVNGIQSTTTTTAAMSGIQLALLLDGGFIVNNTIRDIKNVSTSGTGAFGMQISSTSTAANVTIANNFVSDITGLGSATATSNGFGININGTGTGGYKVYHNSVNMNTNQASGTTAAMLVTSAVTAAGALDVRDNIFANTQTTGATRYGVYSTAAASVFSSINYNDYFAQNVGFIGGVAQASLANWQAATSQDANSFAVDPLFVSTSDLHLTLGSPMIDQAFTLPAVTTDIDGQTRPIGAANDIGADEWIAAVAVSGRLTTPDGQGIKNVQVVLSGGGLPQPLVAISSSFGYYSFPSVPTGATYTISLSAKRFVFNPSSRAVTPYADFPTVDFVSDPPTFAP